MFDNLKLYIETYCEPNSKQLRKDAFEAAKAHFKNKSHDANEFLAFQRGYKGAYRRVYAQTKLSIMKGN